MCIDFCIIALSFAWHLQIRATIICTQAILNCSLVTIRSPSSWCVAVRTTALLSWAQAGIQDPPLMDQSNYSLMTPMLLLPLLHPLHNNNTGESILGNAGRISRLAQLFTGTRFRNQSWAATDTAKTYEEWGIMGSETLPSCSMCTASPVSCKVKEQTQEGVWWWWWWWLIRLLSGCLLC